MTKDEEYIEHILSEVRKELNRATGEFGPFKNSHHGYAVIREELDELWDEVKGHKKPGYLWRANLEAIQVAAMAVRFALDVFHKGCDKMYEDDIP